MKPDKRACQKESRGRVSRAFTRHFYSQQKECPGRRSARNNADPNKTRVGVVNKKMEQLTEHNIKKISRCSGPSGAHIIMLKCQGIIHAIPIIKCFTHKRDAGRYSQDKKSESV